MFRPLVTILGKSVQKIAKIKGGGTALPGLVVERIDANYVSESLRQLPLGVVIISGTNGKTTTTKMVVELLEANKLKVFTNKTGSNFSRGVAAALLENVSTSGKLKADIAVLELDEAHAANFVKTIKPTYSLLLNVMRDQLDRFGEIDRTADLIGKIVEATSIKTVLNREDPLVAGLASLATCEVEYYGLSPSLKHLFPSDIELHDERVVDSSDIDALVVLKESSEDSAVFNIGSDTYQAKLSINGLYNIFNAAGAIALVHQILPGVPVHKLISDLEKIKPAFGRGETIEYKGQRIEIVLVKNPSGFRLGLESFNQTGVDTMIAINDNYADGRDMSWLWDIDFSKLKHGNVRIVSGDRAYDMALRLQYDEIAFDSVQTNLKKSLSSFLKIDSKDKRIYCTYTAMLLIRKKLAKNKHLGEM